MGCKVLNISDTPKSAKELSNLHHLKVRIASDFIPPSPAVWAAAPWSPCPVAWVAAPDLGQSATMCGSAARRTEGGCRVGGFQNDAGTL